MRGKGEGIGGSEEWVAQITVHGCSGDQFQAQQQSSPNCSYIVDDALNDFHKSDDFIWNL